MVSLLFVNIVPEAESRTNLRSDKYIDFYRSFHLEFPFTSFAMEIFSPIAFTAFQGNSHAPRGPGMHFLLTCSVRYNHPSILSYISSTTRENTVSPTMYHMYNDLQPHGPVQPYSYPAACKVLLSL